MELPVCFGQFDSTRFHVDGHYPSESGAGEGAIYLTRGYSRDHRLDLNQVVLQLKSWIDRRDCPFDAVAGRQR